MNKVLLKHSLTHSFTYQLLSCYDGKVENLQQRFMVVSLLCCAVQQPTNLEYMVITPQCFKCHEYFFTATFYFILMTSAKAIMSEEEEEGEEGVEGEEGKSSGIQVSRC